MIGFRELWSVKTGLTMEVRSYDQVRAQRTVPSFGDLDIEFQQRHDASCIVCHFFQSLIASDRRDRFDVKFRDRRSQDPGDRIVVARISV